MNAVERIAPLIGRILMAWMFVPSGWSKIGGFSGSVSYATSSGLPMPTVGVALALLIELLAGLAILVGWQTRIAAGLLALFTLVAAFFFHDYWTMEAAQRGMQKIMFDKNLAIAGGLLFLVAWGPGPYSLDATRRPINEAGRAPV